MKLTNEIPSTWRDLQDKVCKYLTQAGYHSETAKAIDLVRGKVEVDVFATSDDELLRQFVCECKFWESAVPQEKVHAFRTVVHDSGSMLGILISKNGFQKGAIDAAFCSNVILKDWDGFVEMIAKKWLKHRVKDVIDAAFPLTIYTDPMDVPKEIFDNLADKVEYENFQKKYMHSFMISRLLEFGKEIGDYIEVDGKRFEDFNSLFDYLETTYSKAVKEYDELFANYEREDWKFEKSNYLRLEPEKSYLFKKQI